MDTHETQVNQMEMKIEALQENLGICRNATSIDRNRVSVLLGKVMRVRSVNFCYPTIFIQEILQKIVIFHDIKYHQIHTVAIWTFTFHKKYGSV